VFALLILLDRSLKVNPQMLGRRRENCTSPPLGLSASKQPRRPLILADSRRRGLDFPVINFE
jgi:hypothetical protein